MIEAPSVQLIKLATTKPNPKLELPKKHNYDEIDEDSSDEEAHTPHSSKYEGTSSTKSKTKNL
jgi:hypothetical protein